MPKQKNKNLNMIKPFGLTNGTKNTWGMEKRIGGGGKIFLSIFKWECNQQYPESKKVHKMNSSVSSTNQFQLNIKKKKAKVTYEMKSL